MHNDEIQELTAHTWKRIGANCVIWLAIMGTVLSRLNIIDVHSVTMGVCLVAAILAIVYLAGHRATWLPFLGETVLPHSLLKRTGHSPLADIEVDVQADPRATHVAFWAADKPLSNNGASLEFPTPQSAYGTYKNSGIAEVGPDGSATLRIQCPGRYAVRGRVLPKHVHYREVYSSGVMGEVKKANIVCS